MSTREFKRLNIEIFKIGPPSLILVDWEWERSVIPLSRFTIDVYRGEDAENMERIAKNLPAEKNSCFEDTTAYLKDKHRTYLYQVVAVDCKTKKTVKSEISTWEGNLDYVGMYIIEEHDFLFRNVAGMPMLVFKKVTAGKSRCGDCWDKIAKRVMKSNCKSCHGTGWVGDGVGGYFNPSYSYADFSPDPEVIQITQFAKTQPTQTDIFMTNYPRMSVGDLVVELLNGKRWKVANVRDTEKNRSKMLQIVRLDAIEKGDIEYTIEVDSKYITQARGEINARKDLPEF